MLLVDAFRTPRYPVVLGRSHDLACYTSVEAVDLEQHADVYFEHTLLPYSMATQINVGLVALMPRWLDYWHNRQPTEVLSLAFLDWIAAGFSEEEQTWVLAAI